MRQSLVIVLAIELVVSFVLGQAETLRRSEFDRTLVGQALKKMADAKLGKVGQ
jgi:hypothetical protein